MLEKIGVYDIRNTSKAFNWSNILNYLSYVCIVRSGTAAKAHDVVQAYVQYK